MWVTFIEETTVWLKSLEKKHFFYLFEKKSIQKLHHWKLKWISGRFCFLLWLIRIKVDWKREWPNLKQMIVRDTIKMPKISPNLFFRSSWNQNTHRRHQLFTLWYNRALLLFVCKNFVVFTRKSPNKRPLKTHVSK